MSMRLRRARMAWPALAVLALLPVCQKSSRLNQLESRNATVRKLLVKRIWGASFPRSPEVRAQLVDRAVASDVPPTGDLTG